MVTVDGQKMGKSLNNFITLKQTFSGEHEKLTRGYDPLAIRQLVLNSHYRSPIDFSDAALTAAQSGYEKIAETVVEVRMKWNSAPQGPLNAKVADEIGKLRETFEQAMNDDLNTSIALSVIFNLVRLANKLLEDNKTTNETLNAIDGLFKELGTDVLGVVKKSYARAQSTAAEYQQLVKLLNSLMEKRSQARKSKRFDISDAIRDAVVQSDITVIDEADGTSIWRMK
jgi:cysteinyl-tRNA synthetase